MRQPHMGACTLSGRLWLENKVDLMIAGWRSLSLSPPRLRPPPVQVSGEKGPPAAVDLR